MELIQKYLLSWQFPLRREYTGIIMVLLIFLVFPYVVRHVDITAAAIDPGILSAVLLAISSVLIFKAATWWIIKTIWSVLAEYSEEHFTRNFKSLISWQKVVIYLGFYLLIFYAFIIVLASLL